MPPYSTACSAVIFQQEDSGIQALLFSIIGTKLWALLLSNPCVGPNEHGCRSEQSRSPALHPRVFLFWLFTSLLDASGKGSGTSIAHLLTLAKSAHVSCCTSRCTGGHGAHCDLPAAPLLPRSRDNPSGSHVPVPGGIASLSANTQSPTGQLCFLGKPAHRGQRRATRYISACRTTDFGLQRAFQVQGCRYLHCSQVRRPPRGTGAPQSAALHPEITKRTVPAPGAGNYHHRYYNLMRGAASLNRLLLRRQRFPLLGLKSAEYFSG